MKLYVLLIIGFLCSSCETEKKNQPQNNSLTGESLFKSIRDTVQLKKLSHEILNNGNWVFTPFDSCSTSLSFITDTSGSNYDCEFGYSFPFKYFIKNDTLFISVYDIPTEDNPDSKEQISNDDKYIYNGSSLILIDSKAYSGFGVTTAEIQIPVVFKNINK